MSDDYSKGAKEVVNSTDPEQGDSYSITHNEPHVSQSRWTRFKDSFKPMEDDEIDGSDMTDLEKAIARTAKSPLHKSLKNRHLQMIAIGGAIGTGLFIGSGGALATGGPAALLIGWILVGIMIYCTVQALGELAVTFPISGAFNVYSTRFIDPSWGFAMGWNYALQWLVVLPLELVAASITIRYWNSNINSVAWVAIFYVLIVSINFFGVKGYGEAEFIFSAVKVVAVVGFIILGIILNCGGGPKGGYIGGKYWKDPGAFAAGFKGVCTVFVTAAFSFAGTELVALASAESANPRKSLPRATKQVFWRILLFYVISLTLIGLLVPYTDERLGQGSYNASASPFVISIRNAGISGLPSVINVVIMIAVLSVGNSAVFACSRTVTSLAAQGFAPSFFTYVDRKGRPIYATLLSLTVGLLCFVSASPKQGDVFDWLLALSGLSSVFTWGSACIAHIRFRRAMKVQGRDPHTELAYTSQAGVIGSYFGAGLNILILIAQFWVAAFPLGDKSTADGFFKAYLAFPVVIAFYIFHKIWKKNWSLFVRAKDMDIDSGRAEHDLDLLKQEIAEEKAFVASKPLYYRWYRFWC
ncbi:putative histidine permease [Wickerhamomyces ciferrii]|uniref:Histidine permease n=1 Tax=Wickerhamomyces ciferrii (strain ATCC 14091 / BCRC 22168 / CBS 111 / JCM 3599 / NBRC 0793 / NRRL Y-1031 F-60-10) TaxID=1206466 RepID=K0KL42_WICCF|nr:putative histidine permease [Wickerhamomyces ciferrii]CCH41813.1 putative histidine permease [Wickerhamomyces ciferrii]